MKVVEKQVPDGLNSWKNYKSTIYSIFMSRGSGVEIRNRNAADIDGWSDTLSARKSGRILVPVPVLARRIADYTEGRISGKICN